MNPCSAGASAGVGASLTLNTNISFSGGVDVHWNRIAPHAEFDFDGSITGELAAWVNGYARCEKFTDARRSAVEVDQLLHRTSARLSSFHDSNSNSRARSPWTTSIRASATATLRVRTGLHYKNGSWTDYFTPSSDFRSGFDTQAKASARADAIVTLDAKMYGVAGGYVFAGPFAEATADIKQSPWWKVDAGLKAGYGVSFSVLGINASRQLGGGDYLRRQVAAAPGSFPGASSRVGRCPPDK